MNTKSHENCFIKINKMSKITKCRRNLIKIFFISLVCALSLFRGAGVCSAQNIGINGSGSTPNISAGLDVDFTNKGLLIPRVALTQTTSNAPIGASVATSLLVYNTATINDVTPGYYYWDGSKWVKFLTGTASTSAWDLIGNAGTNPATNFIGTTDAQDLVIKAANTSHIRIKGYGITKVRIGELTNSPIATGDPMLDLYSSSGTVIRLRSFTSINKPIFYFQRGRGSATSPSPTLSGDNLGELNWMGTGAATTDGFTSAMIRSISSQNWSGSTTRGSNLEFYTVNTVGASIATDNIANQRMIILPDGPIGINTAGTANARLDIRGGGNTSGTFALGVRNSTDTWMFAVRDDGLVGVNTIAPTANLSVNGSANKPGGGSWAVFSDKRLKNNITDYKEGIELLKQIHTVQYQYNEKYLEEFGFNEDIKSGKTYYGVIAQELQKVSPDMVKEVTLPNGHKYLEADLSKLNITLINTVVNQQTEIDELKKALKEILLKLK